MGSAAPAASSSCKLGISCSGDEPLTWVGIQMEHLWHAFPPASIGYNRYSGCMLAADTKRTPITESSSPDQGPLCLISEKDPTGLYLVGNASGPSFPDPSPGKED